MAAERTGEKIGWTAGWLGGFLWVAILSVVFFFQGKWLQGFLGMILFTAAALGILLLAPWRQPSTPYWKLMIVPYLTFLTSAGWAFWSFEGHKAAGLDWWSYLWLVPLLIPLGTAGRRKWADGVVQNALGGATEPHC